MDVILILLVVQAVLVVAHKALMELLRVVRPHLDKVMLVVLDLLMKLVIVQQAVVVEQALQELMVAVLK